MKKYYGYFFFPLTKLYSIFIFLFFNSNDLMNMIQTIRPLKLSFGHEIRIPKLLNYFLAILTVTKCYLPFFCPLR